MSLREKLLRDEADACCDNFAPVNETRREGIDCKQCSRDREGRVPLASPTPSFSYAAHEFPPFLIVKDGPAPTISRRIQKPKHTDLPTLPYKSLVRR